MDQYYEQRRVIILINASGIVKLEDSAAESCSSCTLSFASFVIPRVDSHFGRRPGKL